MSRRVLIGFAALALAVVPAIALPRLDNPVDMPLMAPNGYFAPHGNVRTLLYQRMLKWNNQPSPLHFAHVDGNTSRRWISVNPGELQ